MIDGRSLVGWTITRVEKCPIFDNHRIVYGRKRWWQRDRPLMSIHVYPYNGRVTSSDIHGYDASGVGDSIDFREPL